MLRFICNRVGQLQGRGSQALRRSILLAAACRLCTVSRSQKLEVGEFEATNPLQAPRIYDSRPTADVRIHSRTATTDQIHPLTTSDDNARDCVAAALRWFGAGCVIPD